MNILKSKLTNHLVVGIALGVILIVFATRMFSPAFGNEMDNKGMLLILICLHVLLLATIHKWFTEYHSDVVKCSRCKTWILAQYQTEMITRRGERFCCRRCADIAHPDLGAEIWEHRWRMHREECGQCCSASCVAELCDKGSTIRLSLNACRELVDQTEDARSHLYALETKEGKL